MRRKPEDFENKDINIGNDIYSPLYDKGVLPQSWRTARFDEVAITTDYVANGSFASLKENVTYRSDPDYAVLVRLTDYTKKWQGSFVYVDKHTYDFLSKSSLEPGDIVIANVGDPGRVFRVPNLGKPMTLGPNSVLVKVKEGIEKGFLAYFFASPWGQDLIAQITTGTAQKKFNKTGLRSLKIPVAPLIDQQRIVAEIEKQLSRLDEAVIALRRVQANLKRYKVAVLKAAVEGKLTEKWRKEHPDVEPAEQLLKRILAERRAKWEADELAKLKAKGLKLKDDSWKKKYKEPAGLDTADLKELPKGWVWATLEQLLCFLRNGISVKPDAETGLPILRISAVRPMLVKLDDVRYLASDEKEYVDYVLSSNDLLFTRYNGNPDLVGVCGVVPELPRTIVHPDKLIRCKLVSTQSLPKYIANMANIGASRDYLAQRVRTTAGQAGISGADLRGMPIPLPPHKEQQNIIEEIDRRLSVTEELEATIETNLKRAERLRQTILQRAFSGGLV